MSPRNRKGTPRRPVRGMSLRKAIKEWCEASNQWYADLSAPSTAGLIQGGGYPRVVTRNRLYRAGRVLFELTGVEPHEYGIYFLNREIERAGADA